MVQYRRNRLGSGSYFLTLTLRNRRAATLVGQVDVLRESFRHVQARLPFTLEAVVVMPDHLHLLCTLPEGDAAYSERIRLLKRYFSLRLAALGNLPKSGLWQPRFWEHTIRDEDDFEKHFNYIHFNPVKHGYVTRVLDWPHSSFHRYVRKGLLPEDWGGEFADDAGQKYGE